MADTEAQRGPEDSASDGNRCRTGCLQEHTGGGECVASASEQSTCAPGPQSPAPEADKACGTVLVEAQDLGVKGARASIVDGGMRRRRTTMSGEPDVAVAIVQSMRILQQRKARVRSDEEVEAAMREKLGGRRMSKSKVGSDLAADIAAVQRLEPKLHEAPEQSCSSVDACTELGNVDNSSGVGAGTDGALVPAERLEAESRALAEALASLAEERQALAESREQAAEDGQAMRQLRQDLDAAKQVLELKAQEAAASCSDLEQLRGEFGAAKRELESHKSEAGASLGDMEQLRRELGAAKQELESQKAKAALRPELEASRKRELEEAARASAAEAARDQATSHTEILRVKLHVAEAEMAEMASQAAALEEELRILRERRGGLGGGSSLLARHELASRPTMDKAALDEQSSRSSGYWLSCCSSLEMQPSKPVDGPQNPGLLGERA
mmetsp:Transcript_42966/g.133540  ORF Transcript_42966/g.133540 Transcript_42966/m.133540 type:complete len:443 (+) Transcript_42966:39-1367(+)